MQVDWKGVFPAVTTQLNADLTINVNGTQRVVDALVRDGVDGLIALGRELAEHQLGIAHVHLAAVGLDVDGRAVGHHCRGRGGAGVGPGSGRGGVRVGSDPFRVTPYRTPPLPARAALER